MDFEVPASLKKPLEVPEKILMGAGPTNCSSRVLNAMKNPVLGHLHPESLKIMDDIKEGIQYLFQTKNQATMCISGSGHAGMEAAMCNLLEDGDVALFGTTGFWGNRAADMAQRCGADVRYVQAKFGHALTLQEVKEAFEGHHPEVFFLAQGDSATGILQTSLPEIGEFCRKSNCILVVDTVASLGGAEFRMDEWKVDVAYTGSQKVLSGPPGITPISFNERAMNRIRNNRSSKIKSYYFDATLVGKYWGCFGPTRIYHHTVCSTLLYGLREAIAVVCEQGLQSVIQRHMECSFRLQKGVEALELEMFVPEPSQRTATINTVKVPSGVDWRKVSEFAMQK